MLYEKTIKSYPPPPEKYSYPHLIRVWAVALLFVLVFAFTGCTDSTKPGANLGNDSEPPLYSLSDIQAAIAEGDYSSPDYETADYPSISFASSFARLSVYTETFWQLYDISGNKAGSLYSSTLTDEYDAIKIEHRHFSQYGASVYRWVKVTLYKQNEYIVSEYETAAYLEAQYYFICSVSSLSVSAA